MTVAIVSRKGGTAKTATAVALAQACAQAGGKALLIDTDPQATSSIWSGADLDRAGTADIIQGRCKAAEAIQQAGRISIITAADELQGLKTRAGSAERLKEAIRPIKRQFDFISIDTAPGTGESLNNAILAATDGILIVLEADAAGLQSLYSTADLCRGLPIIGAVVTRYDRRAKINSFYRQKIQEAAKGLKIKYRGEVRNGIAIREAQALRADLYEYAPKSKPAADYMELYQGITKRK